MERGKQLMAAKEYPRAMLEFRNAAQAMPNDAEPYYQIGLAAREARDLPAAATAFKKAAELNPKHAGAQLRLAELMAVTGDPRLLKDAESRLKGLMETSPVNPEILSVLAMTELRLGNTQDAIENLKEVLAKAPQQLSSSITLALAKLSQKDVTGAEEVLKKACETAPDSVAAHGVLGRFYYSQKKIPEAEAQFRRALELNPKSGPALMDLARLQSASGRKQEAEENLKRLAASGEKVYKPVYALFLVQEGRREEAVREFEQIFKQDPGDRATRTRLVAAYQAVNRTAEAEKILDDVLNKNPKDLEALLQRAEFAIRAGKPVQAESDLNQVVRLKPDSAEVRYTLAKLHQARRNALSYKQELTEALSLNPFLLPARLELAQTLVTTNSAKAALTLLDEAPESQKTLMPVLIQRNWALWALGDLEQLRKAIDQGLSRERSMDLLLQDGLLKLRTDNFAGGRAALEEALKINPADLRALAALKDSYIAEKKPALALQKVKEYAAQHPNSAPVQQFLGTLLIASGEKEQARKAFAVAKANDPAYRAAELSLVQMDAVDGKWNDAHARLTAFLSTNQGHTTARLWLGNIEVLKGDHKAALEQFRKVVEADPGNAQALNNLAYALLEHGRPDEALKYAEKAVELAPQRPAPADTLGWVLYRRGVYGAAVKHLERAALHRDANVVSKYHLAMAYVKAGDRERGRATLAAALKSNPNLPEARMALEVFGQGK
jgi:tetratricopeptide (TPR) repeat protein